LEKDMRILYFAEHELVPRPDLNTLSQFAIVRRVYWQYKAIKDGNRLTILKLIYRPIEGIFWTLKLIKEIFSFDADIVVTRYANFCGLIGNVAAKLSGKKSIVRAVGSDLKVHSSSIIGRVAILLTLKMASGTVCVSRDLEKIAQKFGSKNTRFIPDALDIPFCYENSVIKNNREIITVARLVPVKGIDFLIRALKYVKDATLVIIGDGPEKQQLELLTKDLRLKERVFFTGWITDREKLSMYLKRAKIFALSSISEGTPQAVIEAMYNGLAIVATNVGGIPEIVTDGNNGYLVPPENEKALAEALEKALNDADFQRRACVLNKEIAQRFLLPKVAQNTYDYFKEIAG
jgi:glycosyltransferase involved in cell wall biosynthesis